MEKCSILCPPKEAEVSKTRGLNILLAPVLVARAGSCWGVTVDVGSEIVMGTLSPVLFILSVSLSPLSFPETNS